MFYITFRNRSLLSDCYGNALETEALNGLALRRLYISSGTKALGTSLELASWLVFVIEIGFNPFKSSEFLWVFVNMLQVISFLPVINCNLPENLRTFLTQYMRISKASPPFDSLPNWIPNPLFIVKKFKTPPVSSEFAEAGYKSLSIIYNFSNQLVSFLSLVLIYIVLTIASKIFPKFKYNFSSL